MSLNIKSLFPIDRSFTSIASSREAESSGVSSLYTGEDSKGKNQKTLKEIEEILKKNRKRALEKIKNNMFLF